MAEAPQQGQGTPAPEGGGTQGEGQQEQQASSASEPKSYSQKDLNKIAANEKREGRTSALNELLEQAREVNPDVESVEDVLAAFSEYQGIQEAVTTEADRAHEKAERYEKRAKTAEGQVNTLAKTYALRDALRDSGIPKDRIDDAVALAKMDDLQVEKDLTVSGLEDVVQALIEPRPWLLETQEQTRQRVNAPQTNGTGVATPGSTQDPEQAWANQLLNMFGG